MMENGERERVRYAGLFWQKERRMPQMLNVSVWGTDKALHKFESRIPIS